MDRLRHFQHPAVGKLYGGTLPDSGMSLTIQSRRPFALYTLDNDRIWGTGGRPDGVLITRDVVCFIELKGGFDEAGLRQLGAAVDHFHPKDRSHGRFHHDLWANDEDLPQAFKNRQTTDVPPVPEHQVYEVLIVRRGGTRHAPSSRHVGGKTVTTVVMQRHEKRGKTELDLDAFVAELRR